MKKIPSSVYSYLSSIQQVRFLDDRIYIHTKEGTYLCLDISANKKIYSYFDRISFSAYHKLVNTEDEDFSLFFLEEANNNSYLDVLKDLYEKSVHNVVFDSYKVQQIYNRLLNDLKNKIQYYYAMQDRIEEMYYPRESYYRLILKISDVYHLIPLGEFYLNQWYRKNDPFYREVLTVRNLNSSNFLDGKILDFSTCRRDYFVFELANYYQIHYMDDSILEEISFFQEKFKMSDSENYLFYSLISNVFEIDGESLEEVYQFLEYIQKTYSFLLEKYKEYEKREESMLKEE